MKRTEYLSVAGVVAALLLAMAAPTMAAEETKTLSGKAGSGKLMTRDELRSCMKLQQALEARRLDLEKRQGAMNTERDAIQKLAQEIKGEQDGFASRRQAIEEYNAKMKAFADKIKDFNDRREAFDKSDRTGPSVDRERRKFASEASALKTEEEGLNAERAKLDSGSEQAAAQLSARVESQQKRAQAWNDENASIVKAQQAHEDDRVDWLENCGNRRYKEDDEKAIKAGK